MINKHTEKGQALIVVALAAIVLFGFVAFAVDGTMAFSDRRHAQNAADTAAMAGALAFTRGNDITTTAKARATINGYDNSDPAKTVTVNITDVPDGGCPGNAKGKYIEVVISSTVNTSFARVIGRTQLTNVVRATARGCGYILAPLFPGNAIVGLNRSNSDCAFDSGNSASAHWNVHGGGIFSNGCADSHGPGSVTLDPGACVTTVGTAQNFTCMQQAAASMDLADVIAKMPPNPCIPGGVGLPQGSGSIFNNGVYCITDMDALDKKDIILSNATLYVTDTDFNLKFAGGGGFAGTPTGSGVYANYYMIIAPTSPACPSFTSQNSQVINYRGNGSGDLFGTILAPTACIDLRGNAQTTALHSQIIGYNVSSNGTADVNIQYDEDEQHKDPYQPSVSPWQ